MITHLCLEIPHPLATGCALVILTPVAGGPWRRATWLCRDSLSSFEALNWLCRIAGDPHYEISIRMYERYELGLQGLPMPHPIGKWISRICRKMGGPPAGLRDLMEQVHLCDDPYLLTMVL